ncbi:hypothetical protein AUP68_13683 [Ilyonectria robusta]
MSETLVSFHARCLPLRTEVLTGLFPRNNPAVGEFDTACRWLQRHRVSWSCNVAVATPACNGEPRGRWTQWLMRWDASGRGRPRLTRGSIGSEVPVSRAKRESPTVNSQQSTVGTTKFSGLWLGTWLCGGLGGLKRQAAGLAQERESPVRAAQCGRPQLASLSESQVWVHPKGPRGAWVRFLSDRDPPRALRSQVPERTQRQVQRAQKKQVTAEAGHRRSRAASSRPTITHRPEPLQASRRGRNN